MGIMQYLEAKAQKEKEREEFMAKFNVQATKETIEHKGEVRLLTEAETKSLLKSLGKLL